MCIGLADSADKCHLIMAHQRLFDQRRINIVTTANDQIFGATGDVKIAIRVDPAQIARAQVFIRGIKIAVFFNFRIGVAGINAGVADANLAHFIHRAIAQSARAIGAENPHIAMWKDQTNRADFLKSLRRIDRHKAGAFGQTIALDNLHATGLFEPVEQFNRQGGRS